MLRTEDTIGPYRLIRALGRGAFGEVWLADRSSSLLTVQTALKLPLVESIDLETIRQEATLWLQASGHPNVVPVLDAERYGNHLVIASEFIAGGTLASWLQKHGGQAPTMEAAVTMATGILLGLEHLHAAGIVHRDLKPENVLLQSGIPRLTDFGLSRILLSGGHTSSIAGTPGYMAPEIFSGSYSPASDLWAIGVMLYEMLSGVLPFPQRDVIQWMTAVQTERPNDLPQSVPQAFRNVIDRLLAKSPTDRYESAGETIAALKAAMGPAGVVLPQPPSIIHTLPNNLPTQPTSFIGRERDIAEIRALLERTPMITLTGSGGCGKTRLMLQAAEEMLTEYPDGIWLAELAPLSNPDLLLSEVARAVGVLEAPGQPLITTLVNVLKGKHLLLLLDNCEHLLSAAAEVADALLHACPHLRILASSREGLNIAGETVIRVSSLSLPPRSPSISGNLQPVGFGPDPGTLLQFEAIGLFVERATSANRSFSVSQSNSAQVVSLCQRLDGIPLAIELAAARLRVLSVDQITERLDDRFRLLTGGSRTALPRHQTLRALIDWSYSLLTEPEKALLCRLSVFTGGWTLEAAEQVCSSPLTDDPHRGTDNSATADAADLADGLRQTPIEAWEVLDLLTALVDKSLVVVEQAEDTGRYRLLETVRQYSRDRLMEQGQSVLLRAQHRDYFLKLAEESVPQLAGSEQQTWLKHLDADHDNLRGALEWSLSEANAWRTRLNREPTERAPSAPDYNPAAEMTLRLAGALYRFWTIRGYLSEGRRFLDTTLTEAGVQHRTAASGLARNAAGALAIFEGDPDRARLHLEISLDIRREIGDLKGIATTLGNLGLMHDNTGEYSLARRYNEESLAIRRSIDDQPGTALALANLGDVLRCEGDLETALTLCEESLGICRQLGNRIGMAHAMNYLALITQDQEDYERARTLLEASIEIQRDIGDRWGLMASLLDLGEVARRTGDLSTARRFMEEGLLLAQEISSLKNQILGLHYLAFLHHSEQHCETTVRIWGAVERMGDIITIPLEPAERVLYERKFSLARAAMGETLFDAAWAEGRDLTLEQAIALALSA